MVQAMSMYRHIFKKPSPDRELPARVTEYYNSAGNMDLKAPPESAEYVVIDTELTGLQLKKDSIVSIGAIKMTGRKISLGDIFYRVVEPRTELTGRSVVIHGITPSEATECPDIETLLPEFLEFCGNSIITGHFVDMDINFINAEMKRFYGFGLRNPSVDTLKLYTWLRKNEEEVCAYHGGLSESVDLFSLARKYNIPVSKKHNALEDAFITAQLFQRLLSSLPQYGVRTLRDLLSIGR
jgi:DNA polymerase III subunit epsilon